MIKKAIHYPVTTAVGVIFLVLFGAMALRRVPIQLTPTVQEPQITITTIWPGASAREVEREIIDKQEEQLKSLNSLLKMESTSSANNAQIVLTFPASIHLDTTLIRVSNRLEQVPSYPQDAEKPVITTVNPNGSAIAWFIIRPGGENPFVGDISTLFNMVDNLVKPELERVSGVATSNLFGGRDKEMQVVVDPARLAAVGVTVNQMAAALDQENTDFSGGDFPEGKRSYVVRLVGQYRSAKEIEDVVITYRDGIPVFVRDVASVALGFVKPQAKAYFKNERVLIMNAIRETGSNVMEVMVRLRASVDALNHELLEPRGLYLQQVYDETHYIDSAISLVQQSLILGGFLAIIVLLLFLRSGSSTLVVAVAIPISVVGTFLMVNLFGRTINVISLAGMAFAVGMVVDNSIVVLENIYRHRQMGKPHFKAALDGAREVWGAVLASTLTTIAVFLPILFIEEEAGQLFRDIAIAISCAVALSLLVSITVIPSLSARILHVSHPSKDGTKKGIGTGSAGALRDRMTAFVAWICRGTVRRLVVVVGLTAGAIILSLILIPQTEYLPTGNQNFLFGQMFPPPGYNIEEVAEIRELYNRDLSPLWEAPPEEWESLPGHGIDNFFYVALKNFAFVGMSANEPLRVRELLPKCFETNNKIPGAFAFTTQMNIFQSVANRGRSIDIEITGPELENLIRLGLITMGKVYQHLPGSQARPIPTLDLGNPELQVFTDRRRASELGISNRDLGFALSALVDGIKVSEYLHEGRRIDLKIMGSSGYAHSTHQLEQMPIATPAGELVALGSVADVLLTNGPVQINRIDRSRAVIIRVAPPETIPLQSAMEIIEAQILAPMREEGLTGDLYRTRLSGTADKLTQTGNALKWNLLLAVVITYLLLAALFESFLYPFVILFSVPLAALGGFLGLKVAGIHSLDVLTMLGFVILIGTVVNNAILIVHQSLINIRERGMAYNEAISRATHSRIRPIFMSVATSVCGMLPLVLFPGAGSELYRGLGSVVVGGLVVSTVFTLFLVPALLSLCLDARKKLAGSFKLQAETSAHPTT